MKHAATTPVRTRPDPRVLEARRTPGAGADPGPRAQAPQARAGSRYHRDAAALASSLLDAISAIRRATRRIATRPPELSSLTEAQVELVRVIRRHPGLSVAEAAAQLGVAPNTVSTLLRALSDRSMLVRQVDAKDRRIVRLALDPTVRNRLSAWRDRKTEAVVAALDRLLPAERERLEDVVEILTQLAAHLEDADGGLEVGAQEPEKPAP